MSSAGANFTKCAPCVAIAPPKPSAEIGHAMFRSSRGGARFPASKRTSASSSHAMAIWAAGTTLQTRIDAFSASTNPLSLTANQTWTQWDYTFNSGPNTSMTILMGAWGGTTGNLWFDDISLEETGLVYVLRGTSTPLDYAMTPTIQYMSIRRTSTSELSAIPNSRDRRHTSRTIGISPWLCRFPREAVSSLTNSSP